MKSYSSRDIKAILEANGWYVISIRGDHWKFKHDDNPNTIILTHPVKDVSIGVVRDVMKKSGLKF